MCYEHPNGQHSLLKHAGVFCSTGEHVLMMVGGIAILIFLVVGFLGTCAWAAWHIPRWSLISPQRIRAFAFLISRFRMDRWWYGVLVLLRGPLLSLCPVLATDFPLAQAAMIAGVLIASLLLHIRYTPWKMPLVNLVDGCLQAMLLLLVAITPVDPGSNATEDFHQGIALVMLSCMALVFFFLAFSVALTLLYQLVEWATRRSGGPPLTQAGRQSTLDRIKATGWILFCSPFSSFSSPSSPLLASPLLSLPFAPLLSPPLAFARLSSPVLSLPLVIASLRRSLCHPGSIRSLCVIPSSQSLCVIPDFIRQQASEFLVGFCQSSTSQAFGIGTCQDTEKICRKI